MLSDVIVLHITAQNAGLIIRKQWQRYLFESFELAPTTKAVIGARGRLVRYFPGPAIAVHEDRIHELSCRDALIQYLSELDTQAIEEACPITKKAKNEVVETRDSRDPMFVTAMLVGILRGIGYSVDVARITKHTRDDVLWDRCLLPWRRSCRWLLLRVALQTTLMDNDSHTRYKNFMVYFMTFVLKSALINSVSSDLIFVMLAKINRRMLKLGKAVTQLPCLQFVQNTIESAQHVLEKRWAAIEQHPSTSQFSIQLSHLHPTSDTTLTLNTLEPYVQNVIKRPVSNSKSKSHQHYFTSVARHTSIEM